MYKSRRVPFSLFVNIPLMTPRINFRISECHHRFSIDPIVIFSAKNRKLFLDHTDPLKPVRRGLNILSIIRTCVYTLSLQVYSGTPLTTPFTFLGSSITSLQVLFHLANFKKWVNFHLRLTFSLGRHINIFSLHTPGSR